MLIVKLLSLHKNLVMSLFVLGFNLSATNSIAGTSGGIYDMSAFLNEPHPFAQNQRTSRPVMVSPVNRSRNIRSSTRPTPPPSFKIISHSAKQPLGTSKNHKNLLNSPEPSSVDKIGKTRPKPNLIQSQSHNYSTNFISEIRVGALWHDQGPFSHRKEQGFDGNLEILFAAPDSLEKIWSPRPHVGMSINSAGDTNQTYLGLTWEGEFYERYFADFSIGAGYHDGYKVTSLLDRKSLGCKLLFRESLDIGYRFQYSHSIMAHLDHISNAKLCSNNEGLESVGIRYGYHF